jgi:Protein of unknown function (DUF3995)
MRKPSKPPGCGSSSSAAALRDQQRPAAGNQSRSETLTGIIGARREWPARVAGGLAFASAAVSCYWTAGGTFLLDTVGGAIEELARERSLGAVALGAATVVLKIVAGFLALALPHPPADAFRRRALILANGVASAILCSWGGVNVVVGALVLGGAVSPSDDIDRYALRWHVFLWDMWFLVWGVTLALAVAAARRAYASP